jgi:hypothetical protein
MEHYGDAMETNTVVGLAALVVGIVAAFWLIVLPYRLSQGLLHKWGYHRHCGTSCAANQEDQKLRLLLDDRYRAGMRQGMRGRHTFGATESDKMIEKHSLLPEWAAESGDSETVRTVKAKYRDLRLAFDVTDELSTAGTALSVALGVVLGRMEQPVDAYSRALDVVAHYAGLEPVPPANTAATVTEPASS